MKFYTMFDNGSGSLAIMPHPPAGESLAAHVQFLAENGFHSVISLLTDTEARKLGLTEEGDAVIEGGMDFRSFPVSDMGVPDELPAFYNLACDISRLIKQERRIVVHCWAGIGRSGLLASAVLVVLGDKPDTVFNRVTMARGKQVPETQEQKRWFVQEFLPFFDNAIH